MFSWLIKIYDCFSLFIQNGQVFFWASLFQGVFAKGLPLDKLESRGNRMASFCFLYFYCKGNNGTKCTRFIFGSKNFAHYYRKVQLPSRIDSLLGKGRKIVMV